MKKKWEVWIVLTSVLVFLLIKISNLSFRFGDGNAYLYMADVLWKGSIPYRDYFLADPPFLVLFLGFLNPLLRNFLELYSLVPILLESGTAVILYLLLKRWKNSLAFLAPVLYLFSFTVLSTSDFLTGVQLTVFLLVLGLFFWGKKTVLTGVFFGLAVLTKLYAVPFVVGFLVSLLIFRKSPSTGAQDYKGVLKLLGGMILATILVMGPFLVWSFNDVWNYLVAHQFGRPAGLNKGAVLGFFVGHEWMILSLGIGFLVWMGSRVRKVRGIWEAGEDEGGILILPFLFLAGFFLVFRDLYYLYLDSLMFCLVIFGVGFANLLWKKRDYRPWLLILGGIYLFFGFIYLFEYTGDFAKRGRFLNAREVASFAQTLPDGEFYGTHEVAPLIAQLSRRELFDNQIDTNAQAFGSGALDLQEISDSASNQGVYLFSRITDLPEYGITETGYEGYFDKATFQKSCKKIKDFPSTSNEQDNFIRIYSCKN